MSNVNFQGINIANVNVAGNSFKLYRLTSKDKQFVNELYHNIDLKEMMPNLKSLEYTIWDNMTSHGLFDGSWHCAQSILTTLNKKPCGVANYTLASRNSELNYISTWPLEKGKKVSFAGKSLFMHIFQDFLKTDFRSINLAAMTYAPFDVVSKYLSLGFKSRGGDNFQNLMTINRDSVINTVEKLKKNIQYEPLNEKLDKDLYEVLDVNI